MSDTYPCAGTGPGSVQYDACHAADQHTVAQLQEALTAERAARQQAEATADKFEAQRNRALAALRAVEWVEYTVGRWCCPWCGQHKSLGHEADCPRQAALRETDGA